MFKYFFIVCLLPIHLFAQYNFYYGNIHSHTDYSDGNKDSTASGVKNPGQSYYYAKGSYHFDFLGISEHNHYSSSNNPGMLLPNYAKGLYQADTSNNNGTFVAMYGIEYGTISQGGHVVTYGSKGLIGWETLNGSPNYNIYCPLNNFTTYWHIIDTIPNAFCTLAHPQTGDYGNLLGAAPYSTSADSAIIGTAIRSGSAMSTTNNYSDAPATLYETQFKAALAKGYHLGPTIDHDNHYTTFGRTSQTRTVVLASALNRDSIIAAYRHRRFYAADDWNIQVNYTINGSYMGSIDTTIYDPIITAAITDIDAGDNVSNIKIYYGIPGSGVNATILYQNNNANTITYTHTIPINTTYYYYLKITQTDGDIIWTAPIWMYKKSAGSPLAIFNFNAYQNASAINVNWSVNNIANIASVMLQRSIDGTNYTNLISYAISNTISTEQFKYTDTLPEQGFNYYRLLYKDIHNLQSFSNAVPIYMQTNNFNYSFAPNPAMDIITIKVNSLKTHKAAINIYNLNGRLVLHQPIHIKPHQNIFNIATTQLPAGNYFLVMQTENIRLIDEVITKN
jgi:hypothetical protein